MSFRAIFVVFAIVVGAALFVGLAPLAAPGMTGSSVERSEPSLAARAAGARAFPTARGFGAESVGGRGGSVCRVTSLADSGDGSLRSCIDASGPRTIVFRTGGTIDLETSLVVREPFLTIAGQTAPGDGVALRNASGNGQPTLIVATHDVIVRFIRIRPGPAESSEALDGLRVGDVRWPGNETHDVVVDHVSVSWGLDENVQIGGDAKKVSLQWSIVAEGLRRAGHPGGDHSRGLLLTRGCPRESDPSCTSERISVHHNLMAHNDRRNPQGSNNGSFEIVNNVIYNFGAQALTSSDIVGCDMGQKEPVAWNAVGNYVKPGNNSARDAYEIGLTPEPGEGPGCVNPSPGFELYLDGNIGPKRTDDSQPERDSVEPADRDYVVSNPAFPGPAIPVRVTSAAVAYEKVLKKAGVRVPTLDDVDRRILNDVRQGEGQLIDDPSEGGGWPQLRHGSPPRDSDRDGIPNRWERRHGLDPKKRRDGSAVRRSGYSNLERYLNQLAGDCRPCK